MIKPISLFRGDVSDLVPVRPNLADPTEVISADWVCRTALLDSEGLELISSRLETTKSEDGLTFIISLAPADTLLVTVPEGKKFTKAQWVVQMENDQLSPPYRKEKRITVNVREQAITE